MSIAKIFDVAGSAMNAQMVRMNLTASNLANATTAASSPDEAFKAKKAVFRAMVEEQTNSSAKYGGGVRIDRIVDDPAAAPRIHEPSHPQADKDGRLVFKSAPLRLDPVKQETLNILSELVELTKMDVSSTAKKK